MNEQFYNVSANPHVRDKASTHSIMLDVIIALLPATLFGFWNFGVKAIINTVICVAVCVLAEYVWQRCMHQKVTVKDFSAALTGLLLALNLPPEVPFWIPVIGGLFAIIVVKQLFGGLGQNFMNPALGARCFLLISFAGIMTDFSYKGFGGSFDATTSATPLAALKAGEAVNLKAMFLGNTAGTIGETSAILLILGGIYLIAKKIISWRIPVCYIVTLGIFVLLFWRTWIRYDISRRAVVWWRINAWCIFHGNRLRYIPYYTKGTAYIWYLTWYSDRNLPFIRWFCRGRILCDHLL